MKTKNFLLTGALLIVALFSVNGVMAEEPNDRTTVKIILNPIQSIKVSSDEVTMTYSSIDEYTSGVEGNKKPVLTVNSSGKFQVKVKADGTFFNKLAAGAVTIEATPSKEGASTGKAVLDTGDAVEETLFISSENGGFGLDYTLKFSHSFNSNAEFTNIIDLTKEDTHTATVVYEIIPG